MPHYYAFCTNHGKCGDDQPTDALAWADVDTHIQTVGGPHGPVYTKLSTFSIVKGVKKYRYKSFKIRPDGV